MKHAASDQTANLEYSPDGTQGCRVWFGVFVLTAFLIPTTIVTVQWLASTPDAQPATDPAVIPVAMVLMLWPVWQIGARNQICIDGRSRTIRWKTSLFGLTIKTEVWDWREVTSIEVNRNPVMKSSSTGYCASVAGPRGRRYLLTYFPKRRDPPDHIRDTARMLGLAIQLPE